MSLDMDALWFEALLQKYGIVVSASSPLSEHLSVMKKIPSWLRDEYHFPSNLDLSSLFNIVLGLNYQIKAIARALKTRSADAIIVRLKEIFYGPNVILSMYVPHNKDRDSAWELLVGCLVALIADNLTFGEPDIRCLFEGVNWGIECKYFYSNNRNKHVNNIVDGVKQIEASPAELGCIFINVSNLIAHYKYFHQMPKNQYKFWAFNDPGAPHKMLYTDVDGIINNLLKPYFVERIIRDRKTGLERNKTRSLLFLGQTVSAHRKDSGSAATSLATCIIDYRFRNIRDVESRFFDKFNQVGADTHFYNI